MSAASIIGDLTAYELGRKFSLALSARLIKFNFFKNSYAKAKEMLKKYIFSLVFFSRFALTGICTPVSYIGGFEKLDRKKYFVAVVFGEILYGIIYPTIGFAFKETWNDLAGIIGDVAVVAVLIVMVAFLLAIFVIKRHNSHKNNFS